MYAYTILELYNITEERNSKGLKKFTYDSLSRDGKHAYFAAHCDYLVTEDKGLRQKAFILYELFGMQTQILTVSDFINNHSLFLRREDDENTFRQALIYDIKHALQITDKTDIRTGVNFHVYKTTHIYFNYFNRMQRVDMPGVVTLTLFCERNRIAGFLMHREIQLVIFKLIEAFGPDIDKKGLYEIGENIDADYLRMWMTNNGHLSLYVCKLERGVMLAFDVEMNH